MALVTITAANVQQVSGTAGLYTAGETITAGALVRLNSATNKVTLTTDTSTGVVGFALAGASDGQPVPVQRSGTINIGGTLEVGMAYIGSATGQIRPVDDMGGNIGDAYLICGVALTTSNLRIGIIDTGLEIIA